MISGGNQHEISISMEVETEAADPDKLKHLIENILERFKIQKASVDVTVTGDSAISQLHKQYMGKSKITDVISFDLSEEDGRRCFQVAVNAEQAARESAERKLPLISELALYVTHGILHNLGFDDSESAAAKMMHRMEDEILIENGYGAVYHAAK